MRVYHRPFDPDRNDYETLWRFLQKDFVHKQDHFIWHFSRLGGWKYGLWREQKYIPSFFRKHVQLWVDRFDRLLGFVISEDGDDVFFIFTLHGYEYLYAEILDWTIAHWQPRYGKLTAEVHEFQTDALATLAVRGFEKSDVAATTRIYDLNEKANEPVQLAPGFQIMTMAENGDYPAKAALHLDASGPDQVSEFDLLRFEYARENPAYDPNLDLLVVTADGRHVASCTGFIDSACAVAEIENVCTHSDYRRQGMAEAVIRECFHRLLKNQGIQRAYITGYSTEANGLYEKLGPCQHKQWFHYQLSG